MMRRPSTLDGYKHLVNEAIVEVDELRMSVEYDEEFMEDVMGFVGRLEKHLSDLQDALQSGGYEFTDEDLPFMEIINSQGRFVLPFQGLLKLINQTHRQGLETAAS